MAWLKERLTQDSTLILPGAFDALSAKLIEYANFESCYCSGFSTSAAAYGLPDLGLLGLEEVAGHYQRIRSSIKCPMIVDADTGFGGLFNLERTVQRFSDIGIAACHIEDQVFPKRCGHMRNKTVVSRADAVARIKLAVTCSSMDIIGRTDAIQTLGFEEAIYRSNLFFEAGAVAVFIDAPQTREHIEKIPQLCDGPVLFNAAPIGSEGLPSDGELSDMGYRIIIHPIEALLASANATFRCLQSLRPKSTAPMPRDPLTFSDLNRLLGVENYLARENEFASKD